MRQGNFRDLVSYCWIRFGTITPSMMASIRLDAYRSDVAVDFYDLTASRFGALSRREGQDDGVSPAGSSPFEPISLCPFFGPRLG